MQDADPGTVDHHPAEGFARSNQLSNRPGKIGVIHRGGGIRTAIDHRVAQLGEIRLQGFLEGEAAVIGTDGDRLFRGGGCSCSLREACNHLPDDLVDFLFVWRAHFQLFVLE